MHRVTDFLVLFAPSAEQVLGALAVMVVLLILSGLGALVGGRERFAAGDLVSGWAVAGLVTVLLGTLTSLSLTVISGGLALAGFAGLGLAWKRDGRVLPAGAGRMLLLAFFLYLVTAGMMPSQWDEFSHWLFSAGYLFQVDGFPGAGRPPSPADLPAYPYGVSLVPYFASRLAGQMVDTSGPLFNVTLLLSFGLAVAQLINRDDRAAPPWGLVALGFLAVSAFNPTFVQKVILTAYADLPSAAALGFAGLCGWLMLQALSDGEKGKARVLAWQVGLALAALVNAKQANLVLAVFLMGGFFLVALRDRSVGVKRFLVLLPVTLGPMVVIYLVWRSWVAANFSGSGEQGVMPFELWALDLIPETLASMLKVMSRKGVYFGFMILASGLALRALWKGPGPWGRLAVGVGAAFVGYNVFLFFAYVAIFGGYEAKTAASYWRYNQHLGLLGVALAWLGIAALWRERFAGRFEIAKLSKAAVVVALLLPIAFAPKLRFDVHAPKQYVKRVGQEIRTLVPEGARVLVVDPLENGFYYKLMKYVLYGRAEVPGNVNLFSRVDAEGITENLRLSTPSHLWVHTQNDGTDAAFGQVLERGASHLLEKDGADWRLVKSWPYPGYALPSDVED